MSWFGGWFGGTTEVVETEPEPGPDPIEVPVVFGDPLYVDHVAEALSRLGQQFRSDP